MAALNLRPFGFMNEVEVHGTVETIWAGGNRLVFLFGEDHRDRQMKQLNVENACRLVDARVVGCAGTEVPMRDLDGQTQEFIMERSHELFAEHRTDEAVINHLSRSQPWWYGILDFGNTLKVLRPCLPVRCVEDPELRERMESIRLAYIYAQDGRVPHPYPEHPNLGDHPLNRERERAMIGNLLNFWDSSAPTRAVILNTGSGHCQPIADELRERGISYILISIPPSPWP
jgi:hypothetical protein